MEGLWDWDFHHEDGMDGKWWVESPTNPAYGVLTTPSMQEPYGDSESKQRSSLVSLQIHLVVRLSRFNKHESRPVRGSLPDLISRNVS